MPIAGILAPVFNEKEGTVAVMLKSIGLRRDGVSSSLRHWELYIHIIMRSELTHQYQSNHVIIHAARFMHDRDPRAVCVLIMMA
jgi:hypothetical protein